MFKITSLMILSHSRNVAESLKELVLEMAEGISAEAVGGSKDGSAGADFDRMLEVLTSLTKKGKVIILFDLGSTLMTIQMVIDTLDDEEKENVYLSDAALVEGAIVSSVLLNANSDFESIKSELEKLSLNKIQ